MAAQGGAGAALLLQGRRRLSAHSFLSGRQLFSGAGGCLKGWAGRANAQWPVPIPPRGPLLPLGLRASRGGDDSAALAEPDAPETGALAGAAQDELVTVLKELPVLAGGQADRLGAPPGQLQHAASLGFLRSRYGPARQQVTGTKVAPVARVMGEHLRDRPVHVGEARPAQARRRYP